MSRCLDSSRSARRSPRAIARWSRSLRTATLACGIACCAGCETAPRVVLVPQGHVMRVGPDAELLVYTEGSQGEWVLSAEPVRVPEGWYIVDDPNAIQ